ncbi:MAG: HD domain-containing phosphohydrolase [Fibrobacterota bacterium]
MSVTVVLLGAPSSNDISILNQALRFLRMEVDLRCVDLLEEKNAWSDEAIPNGFINFYNEEQLPGLFPLLPIGVGERVPFFQRCFGVAENASFYIFPITGFFVEELDINDARNIFSTIRNHIILKSQHNDLIKEVIKYRKQKQQLIKISTALSSKNNIEELLEFVLAESRDIVGADAGSIYIRKREGAGKKLTDVLQFCVSQNDSVRFLRQMKRFELPIDKNSIAGYVAGTGNILNIPDVNKIDDSSPYKHGSGVNKKLEYTIRSMLTVPFKNMAGTVVGVIQLINKKRDQSKTVTDQETTDENVIPFRYADEDFIQSIASLAAVTIERAQLHADIKQLFEGFLDSSIAAVDERDRITSGHSRRVAGYAMAFVDAINSQISGPFADQHFSEERKRQFKFAALLHDIGKIGVPERLLKKELRIENGKFESILMRLEYIRHILVHSPDAQTTGWQSVEELENDRDFLIKTNKTGFLSDADYRRLRKIREKYYFDSHGEKLPLFKEGEFEALSLKKGNLTPQEREVINSHTTASFRILSKIPWTAELERIPQIASQHHEKLDGSGYPHGLAGQQIDLESRILAVVDIYEALVAQDRPYKPAMPPERALTVLRAEAEKGRLDSNVVEFFANTGIYRNYLDQLSKKT